MNEGKGEGESKRETISKIWKTEKCEGKGLVKSRVIVSGKLSNQKIIYKSYRSALKDKKNKVFLFVEDGNLYND